jgi:UDP-glucose 4,6-dehydratase
VSSGSIYAGVKVLENSRWRVEKNVAREELAEQYAEFPERFCGFSETDEPNFTFRYPPCDFYSGTKALAEEAIREIGESYIWRLREPFNERDEKCNLLARMGFSGLTGLNSFSHLEDSVRACLDLWEYRAPYGIYNVVNPGAVDVRVISQRLQRLHKLGRFSAVAPVARRFARGPRSNCVLDASKLIKAGVKMRPLAEAVEDSVERLESFARSAIVAQRAHSAPSASLR